ncbi:hypothetical protein [Ursidibacter sp. B-7004-1]
MIYISIPVHEKMDVIVDQMKNFEKYFPEAMVVLHLSQSATFSIEELEEIFLDNGVTNTIINPIQVKTSWGAIIQAHLENIRYIVQLGNAEKVIFHSSNDMLVRQGVYPYVRDKKNIFHQRKCFADSLWWVSRRALKDKILTDYFDNNLQASQIEGSMYEIKLLTDLINEIDSKNLEITSQPFYPREEIIFSSFANKTGIIPDGLPYIFSEVNQFDKVFFDYIKHFKCLLGSSFTIHKGLRYLLSTYLEHLKFYRIDKQLILKIRERHQDIDIKNCLDDGDGMKWKVFHKNSLFGVKRIERELNNPVRKFIRNELR